MKYLLDTNICVHFFRGKFGVFERFEAAKAENCANSPSESPERDSEDH